MLRVFLVVVMGLIAFAAQAQSPIKLTGNGLKGAYYVYNADRDRMVAQLIFNQGEAHNPYAEGLAHYVEHLAWLNALGLEHGDPSRHSNASTTLTQTTYWLNGEQSEFVDMLQKLHRVFMPFEIERKFMAQERDIIMREYDYRVRENTQYPVYIDMNSAFFGGTVYGRDVLGLPEDIKQFSIDDAIKLHGLSHRPAHATLVIMGNLPVAAVRELVAAEFPSDQAQQAGDELAPLNITSARNIKTMPLEDQTEEELVFQKFVANGLPKATSQLGLELMILEDILESTREGGMAKALRYDDFIARDFDIDLNQPNDGYFSISFYASPDRGVDLEHLLQAFEENLEEIATKGIPQETFDKLLKRAQDEFGASIKRSDAVYSDVPYYLSLEEEPQSYDEFLENLGKVTREQINTHLLKLVGDGHAEIRFVVPKS
ncbi:M16 family metallopeptidase [Maritalea porphyrae]|uniref:M16 family metallopeptidase n=1 Tax=Maritalea porphyrae TaxID=880732 RepID=UPI0022AF4C20|nr:insulinase family protein [Maritalea porphyrae]MCZ4272057.1 insulinase family protein [Maritalea porphyrae]